MMKGRVEPSTMPTMVWAMPAVVHATRQTIKVPQMTSPHERQLREQRHEVLQMTSPQEKQLRQQGQKIKREHDTRSLKGEEHLHFDDDIYED